MRIVYYKNINDLRENPNTFEEKEYDKMVKSGFIRETDDAVLFVYTTNSTQICTLPEY